MPTGNTRLLLVTKIIQIFLIRLIVSNYTKLNANTFKQLNCTRVSHFHVSSYFSSALLPSLSPSLLPSLSFPLFLFLSLSPFSPFTSPFHSISPDSHSLSFFSLFLCLFSLSLCFSLLSYHQLF